MRDTVYIEDAGDGLYDTIGIRTEIEFSATTFSLDSYGTYRRRTELEQREIGSLKEIAPLTIVLNPDKVYRDDDETGIFSLSQDPFDYRSDTLIVSFPAEGRMHLVVKDSPSKGIVLTCR